MCIENTSSRSIPALTSTNLVSHPSHYCKLECCPTTSYGYCWHRSPSSANFLQQCRPLTDEVRVSLFLRCCIHNKSEMRTLHAIASMAWSGITPPRNITRDQALFQPFIPQKYKKRLWLANPTLLRHNLARNFAGSGVSVQLLQCFWSRPYCYKFSVQRAESFKG